MKKLKKLITLFSVALLCLVPIFSTAITAEASTPYTWYIKYVEELGQWRYQVGSWKDDGSHREIIHMHQYLKDGDIIVVDGNGDIDLDVEINISNLTILNPGTSIVTAKSVDKFYAGGNCTAAVNCDVKEAYVYDQCSVNFNNNVSYLELICKEGPKANVAVMGTLNHLKGWDGTKTSYEAYNFAAGKLNIVGGTLKTEATDYSTTPSAAPVAPAPSTPSVSTPSADEYDAVPKTGDLSISPVWFLAIAMICLLGSYKLKTK